MTGGLGFIGSNFVRHELENHDDVRIVNLDNLSYGANMANLSQYSLNPRYRFVRGDIANRALVKKLVRDADLVVNFAAESHVDRSISDAWPFVRSNTEGVVSLLEAVRSKPENARLVQVSTDEVYGSIRKGSAKEADALKPSSPYAASKAAADMFCLAYRRTYGLNIAIARCTNNFGPFQFPEKLIPKTIISALRNRLVPVYGSGRQIRDWNNVEDNYEALDLIARNGRAGQIYNISTGRERDNLSVIRSVLRFMNKDQKLARHVEDRPGHDYRYSLDSTKIREELGWQPRHTFLESLGQTVAWYLDNRKWWQPLATNKVLSPEPWKEKW